ncbi:MAG: N-acetylmuramoyl-L-alanine amidase-like domain-containing protein [Cyanobium sp.]
MNLLFGGVAGVLLFAPPALAPTAMAAPQPLWAEGTPALLQQGLKIRQGLATGDALVALARRAIGRPYVAFSLDQGPSERLQLDLSRFDCFLFVEQLLALVQLHPQRPGAVQDAFADRVRRLRYEGGRVDYCHRQHYFSGWAAAAQRQGLVSDITATLPGARSRRIPLRFMSTHPQAYKPMRQDANRRCIAQLEAGLVVQQAYVPIAALGQALPHVQNGDIFGLVTRVNGLDVTHVGLVEVEGNRRHALHAAPGKGVMRSRDLARYVAGVEDVVGLMVLRPTS